MIKAELVQDDILVGFIYPQGTVGPRGPQGLKGEDGSNFQILGLYPTVEDLVAAHPTGEPGNAYAVGESDSNTIYV